MSDLYLPGDQTIHLPTPEATIDRLQQELQTTRATLGNLQQVLASYLLQRGGRIFVEAEWAMKVQLTDTFQIVAIVGDKKYGNGWGLQYIRDGRKPEDYRSELYGQLAKQLNKTSPSWDTTPDPHAPKDLVPRVQLDEEEESE